MARMLQALKNLEARSAWPAAGAGVLSHLSDGAKPAAPPVEPAEASPPAPPLPQFFPPPPAREPEPVQFAAPSAIVVQPPKQFDESAGDAFVVNTFEPRETAPQPEAEPPPPPATRPPTGAERAVRRTLGEPHRRQPLADLAARLRQDAHKTGSRTLLLAGVGFESATHETALHLASVLADEGGRVLLVDGDLARRQLSADLDDLQEPGLSNLSGESRSPKRLLQPTAVPNLVFLPVGTERFADLEAAAVDLTRAIGALAADFDLVLVDGGRTDDPSLATLARLCDATYIVIQLGAVEATQAQKALRDLRAGGARVLGCIATGSEA